MDLNLPKLYNAGAVTKVDGGFKLYLLGWTSLSAFGILCQCVLLWHFKKTGKELHPMMKEAVDAFEHGKTAEERKRAKRDKTLALYVENQLDADGDNESLYLDMQSRSKSQRSNSLDKNTRLLKGSSTEQNS